MTLNKNYSNQNKRLVKIETELKTCIFYLQSVFDDSYKIVLFKKLNYAIDS